MDSSFQFALAGREKEARQQYATGWKRYLLALSKEQHNITLPGERELVATLTAESDSFRRQAEEFFRRTGQPRENLYFGGPKRPGLYGTFREIKGLSAKILQLNQDNMETADRQARDLARSSLIWYGGGLAVGVALAVFLVAGTIRTILYPIRAVTESAAAIGAGNLDQLVPVYSKDELGQLAAAFNAMTHRLREYQQSQKAQLIRRSRPARPRSTPSPIRCWWWTGSSASSWRIRLPAASSAPCLKSRERMRPWCGSPPSPCGSLWPTSWRTSGNTCRKASTRPLPCR